MMLYFSIEHPSIKHTINLKKEIPMKRETKMRLTAALTNR
jgi:hypothetical protein